jgi:hypothetical protein
MHMLHTCKSGLSGRFLIRVWCALPVNFVQPSRAVSLKAIAFYSQFNALSAVTVT